ncbi:MAG: helix-turn-helix domain-containing protein [Bacteroides sp.]|nr:helix-turn-helix domain-containing protein [Bacillota bacterium]MCM1455207.1 helix-turn-helix domain-containing protein [Bacteroides sp.]
MYGKRIRDLRKESNYTQKQLANILQVDFRTVSFWETERFEPNIEQIIKICNTFNVSADYIIGRSDF